MNKSSGDTAIKAIINQLRDASCPSQTQKVAQAIILNTSFEAVELAKCFDTYFTDREDLIPIDLKVNILETMSGVILMDKNKRFLRHFATRIFYFFQLYSQQPYHLHRPISVLPKMAQRIIEVFKQLETSRIFLESFLDKLKRMAVKKYAIQDPIFQTSSEKKQKITKYSQNFLQMLKDVQEVEQTNQIYKMKQLKANCLEEAKKINEQMGKFERVGESTEEKHERVIAMKRDVENVIESLCQVLQLNQQGMDSLRLMVQEEQSKLEKLIE